MQDQASGQARYTRNALWYMKFENSLPTKQCFSTDSSYTVMFGAAAHTAQFRCKLLGQCFEAGYCIILHTPPGLCMLLILAVRDHLVYETHSARLTTLSSEFNSVFKGSLKKW
jgi:hypothetical protein